MSLCERCAKSISCRSAKDGALECTKFEQGYMPFSPAKAEMLGNLKEPAMDTVKDRKGKPRMSLILPRAAEALVRVREYGLKKYPDANNWKRVPKEDWLDALMRHLMKYLSGEKLDSESGLPHLWHALCNLCYLIEREW